MVGFFRESSKPEEESGANQLKLKTSNCPESFRFDFEDYSPEFGVGFSLASVEPFLDFDSIKDWVEEMEAPDDKAEVESGFCVENKLVDSVKDMDGSGKLVVVKVECSASEEHMGSRDGVGRDNGLVKLDGIKDCIMDGLMKKDDLVSSERSEVDSDGAHGEIKTSGGDEADIGIVGDGSCSKIERLNCSIEEGLEKVTLVGDEEGVVVAGNGVEKVDTPVVKEDSDSDSESECETSSSSSSASSSSSESDDDGEEEEVKEKEIVCKIKRENAKQNFDMEEGQIMDSDAENMVSWSENEEKDDDDDSEGNSEEFQFDGDAMADEDEDTVKGPIKSANELKDLPPVPPVNVTLQPCHQILPVGVVSSVLGAQVIVEGSEKHDPLSEGSILWIVEGRLPLGIVDEIFGPVKTPYYIVRYNSESEVPSGIQNGTLVGFVLEFVGHVLNDKNLYQKGYDASGENDEEVLDEFDFSDDEKEAEYKRMIKMSKRGNNNQWQGPGNKRKNNRNRGKTWTKDQPSASQSPTVQSSQPTVQTSQDLQPRQMQQHMRPLVSSSSEGNQLGLSPTGPVFSSRPAVPSSSQGYQLGPSPMGAFFPRGPTLLPQQLQQAGFLLNGLLANGIPFQQQNMAFPSGFQINSMPWLQQQHPQNLQAASASLIPWQQGQQQQHISQMPITNPALCQQPFDLSQLVSGNSGAPLGPMNFAAGPTNVPWAGMFGHNVPNQAPLNVGLVGQNLSNQAPLSQGFQGPSSQLPALQGQSSNSQPLTNFGGNDGTSPQFSQGRSSGRGGRGRGRKPFHRRGGHFGGRGGRQQPH